MSDDVATENSLSLDDYYQHATRKAAQVLAAVSPDRQGWVEAQRDVWDEGQRYGYPTYLRKDDDGKPELLVLLKLPVYDDEETGK